MADLIEPGERLRRLCIVKLPDTPLVSRDTFEIVEDDLPQPGARQILLRVIYFSVDAGTRASMDTKSVYVMTRGVGESPIGSNAVGQVVASRHPDYPLGSLVRVAVNDYQSHLLSSPDEDWGVLRIEPGSVPLSAYGGTLGTTGFTAYAGVFGPFPLRAGECFVVSAAAGSVGSLAGQFARIAGARVVGIAGGKEKCDYLVNELGFDAAVDYKDDLQAGLDAACPDGIDYYFENVGGDVQRAVFARMNTLGRIAICGQVAQYSGAGEPDGPNLMVTVNKRLSIRGFLSLPDYPELIPQFDAEGPVWLREGRIKSPVTITRGLENAHEAINSLVEGRNIGKQLIQFSEEPDIAATQKS